MADINVQAMAATAGIALSDTDIKPTVEKMLVVKVQMVNGTIKITASSSSLLKFLLKRYLATV